MRENAANSQEICRPFDSMEFPRVAHIVADLDALEAEDRIADRMPAVRSSQSRELYRNAPSLKHTVFASAMRLLPVVLVALLSACSTTGATFRSGVGDAFPDAPPYYAGKHTEAAKIVHLPVMFQAGAAQSPVFDPPTGADSEVAALLRDMNAYLQTLSTPLVGAAAATGYSSAAVAPDVRFGCATEGNLAGGDCVARGDSALGRGRQTMHLAVGRPSDEWAKRTGELLNAADASQAIVITLEVGNYLTRQSGWRGSKSVQLGTAHEESLPWLTSLETPVAVLQVTGALVDASGKVLRIGAEGIAAQPTRLLVSSVGGQELFGDEQVRKARSVRRPDLPGEPLAWQVALRDLVVQLTGTSR